MFTEHGRPVAQTRVDAAVRRAAAAAGIGHVTPHQLRHTLATQAINRGMSLEAIPALLGHRSMSMTLTYARIADRTVAEEYFAVSQQVEALYDTQPVLPAGAEGPNMRRLHAETTRRLLGNGYCTRPRDLGCRYETMCETCTFFTTTIEFRDQLQARQADAQHHGDTSRQNTYLKILGTLDTTGT
jgi:Phage integrase family